MIARRHHLFGLTVAADFELPGLPAASPDAPIDVVIESAPVPAHEGVEPTGLYVRPDGALLNIPEAGRFLIRDGRHITVERGTSATDRNVRLYLLGSAFGAILHQRGMLPLHANIIDVGGAAVAFAGHSGAGKSTLASWFNDRGFPVLGDDVCVVARDVADRPIAVPGLPRIRLWGDALARSGRQAGDFEQSFDDMDKYDVPTASAAVVEPLPLAAVYALHVSPDDTAGSITREHGIAAVETLVANTYRGAFVPLLDGVRRHLSQCVTLARDVPIFRLQRRWGLDVLDEEAAGIEAHARSLVGG